VRRSRRLAFAVATPFVQAATAVVLAVAFSRLGRDETSGWSDLIGVIVGVVFGAGLGLGLVLATVATVQSRSIGHRLVLVVVSLPSALAASIVAGLSGVDFWSAYVCYLVVCMCVVWWYSGRSA